MAAHDYAAPACYFVTICADGKDCILGEVVNGQAVLSLFGEIAREEWWRSATLRDELELGNLVVMPNHLHAIVSMLSRPRDGTVGAHGRAPLLSRPPRSLGSFVAGFKAASSRRINELRETPGARVWQRNYHEHTIRDRDELERIRRYVLFNPLLWREDPEHPDNAVARRRAVALTR